MTLRTVTSPSITNLHGAARGGDTVVFTLLSGTYSATEHVPQDRQAVTIADDGSLSVVLYCPARYHCTIAGAMSFYFTLPESTAPTTLESLHASSAAAPDATNELQTMIDALNVGQYATQATVDALNVDQYLTQAEGDALYPLIADIGIFNVEHYATPQAAIDAAAVNGGVVQFKAGKTYTWTSVPKLPAALTHRLILQGNGATITLSAAAPRFLDFNRTANDQVFQHITIDGFLIDANTIDGLACGASTTVNGTVSITAGQTGALVLTDASSYLTTGILYAPTSGLGHFYTKVNATTLNVRNDTSSTITFTNGNTITGACRDHVVIGTMVQGGSTAQNRMSFDRITVRNIRTVNVPSSMTVTQTYRPNIFIGTVPLAAGEAHTFTTNILIEDVDFSGGNTGIFVGGGSTFTNTWCDTIVVRRWRHTTNLVPTANVTGAHVQLGGGGYGGSCYIEQGWGEYSADVGIETDAFDNANVTDVVIEDSYGGGFFATNFNNPGLSTGASAPTKQTPNTTISNGGTGITSGAFVIPVASVAGLNPSGTVLVENEMISYNTISGLNLQTSIVRGAFGSTAAAHADGASVLQIDTAPGRVRYTRCHYRRTRFTAPASQTGLGFYQYNLANIPPPALIIRDCSYFRRGTDFITNGEALFLNGGTPLIDVDEFNVVVEGINHPSGTVNGSVFYVVQPSPFTSTSAGVPLNLKNVRISLWATAMSATDTLRTIYLDRGAWHIHFEDIAIFLHTQGIGSSHSSGISFAANPTNYLSGEIKRYRYRNVQGDLAPLGLSIPSTTFCVVRSLKIEDTNFRDISYAASNYFGFSIDATNAANVQIRNTTNPTGITTLPGDPPAAITPGASPYAYQNLNGYPQRVVVQGGTVSKIELSQDGTTYYDIGVVAGVVYLDTGDYLKTTYTVAPTMTKVPVK